MMPATTNIPLWHEQIKQAISEKGQQQPMALCHRLSTIEALLFHQAGTFEAVLSGVIQLLNRGIPCDYIVRVLASIQPQHAHAQPQELALIQELTRHVDVLGAWSTDAQWLNWFIQMEYPSDAANFLCCLREQGLLIKPFNDALMKACSTPQRPSLYSLPSSYLSIRFPIKDQRLWAKCLVSFQTLSADCAQAILPLMLDSIERLASPQSVFDMLALLKERKKPFEKTSSLLLSEWWSVGLRAVVSPEALSLTLEIIFKCDPFEKEKATQWVTWMSSMIRFGMQKAVSVEAISRANACLDQIRKLKDPLQKCYGDYVIQQQSYFDEAWLCRFQRVMMFGVTVSNPLLPETHLSLLDIAMKGSDVELTISLLERIQTTIETHSCRAISLNTVISSATKQPNPLQHLQAFDRLLTTFYAMDGRVQIQANTNFTTAASSSTLNMTREADFFAAMLNIGIDGLTDEEWALARQLWSNKTCTNATLRETMVFYKVLPLPLKKDLPFLRDIFHNTTPLQRQLMTAHVLPQVQDINSIKEMWMQMKSNSLFLNPAFLNQVIALQHHVDNMTDENFNTLLQFDNASQQKQRQLLLHAMHHNYIKTQTGRQKNSGVWWLRYIQALSEWISKPITGRITLNQVHHASALRALTRTVKAAQELQSIADPFMVLPHQENLSASLITTIQQYESSYSAAWWKSRDRKALAKDLFLLGKQQENYTSALNKISNVMQCITREDQKRTNQRNKKGYSRLYDISVQLLSSSFSNAVRYDHEHADRYILQVQNIIKQQQQLCATLNLDRPPLQHLQEVMESFNRMTESCSLSR